MIMAYCNKKKVVTTVVGYSAIGMAFVITTYNVFALAIKARFKLTQTQLELLISLGYLGLSSSIPCGALIKRTGPRIGAGVALVVSSGSYILIWSAVIKPDFYLDHFPLVAAYFFISGCGSGLTFISSTSALMPHYIGIRQGSSLGFIFSAISVFPIIIIFIYNTFFANGHYTDPENQDVEDFLLFIATGFGIVNISGMVFYFQPDVVHETIKEDEELDEGLENLNESKDDLEINLKDVDLIKNQFYNTETLSNGKLRTNGCADGNNPTKSSNENNETADNKENQSEYKQPTGWEIFKNIKYHCTCWSFAIVAGLAAMHINNLTSYLASFGLDRYAESLPYINPILGIFFKPLYGFFSDKLEKYIPKPWWLLLTSILMMLSFLFCIFVINDIISFILTLFVIDIANFVFIVTTPDLLVKYFGIKTFSISWGFSFGMYSSLSFITLMIFGFIYDSEIDPGADTSVCYGLSCYTDTLIMATILCFVCVLLTLYLLKDEPLFTKCKSCIKHIMAALETQDENYESF